MSPSAVDQNDVANLPLQLNGKQNGVENVKMEEFEKTDLVLRTFRCLIADLCHQFGCGHPGYVSGLKITFNEAHSLKGVPWEWQASELLFGNTP